MADRAQGILLETSAVIAHLRGRIDLLALTTPTEPLFLPLVTLGELYKGAKKSARSAQNRKRVDDFLQIATLLYPDGATAEIYATAPVDLEFKGQPSLRTISGLPLSRSNAICRWRRVMPISSAWKASLSLSGSR
jgi:predicted nucleic acid-binding protein